MKIKNVKFYLIISFLVILLTNNLINVKCLGIYEDPPRTIDFSPQVYNIYDADNYTYVVWDLYEFPLVYPLTSAKYFQLNTSYDYLPAETLFELIPIYLRITDLGHVGHVAAGFYQSYVDIDLYDVQILDYSNLGTIYQSGSFFESQFSFTQIGFYIQDSYFNFTKVGNNLYSQMFKIWLTSGTNLIIGLSQPYTHLEISLTLFHDYNETYESVDVVSSLPIYDSSGVIVREEPMGAVFDRFIDNASFVGIMFMLPVFLALKVDKKMLGITIIISSVLAYLMGLVTIIQIIISVICALFIALNQLKKGVL